MICAVFVCLQLCSVSARAASTAGLTGSLTGGMAGGLDLWRSWSDGNLSHISVGAELGRPPKPSKLPKTASLPNIYQYYASTRIFAKSRDTVRQMLICLVVIKQCSVIVFYCFVKSPDQFITYNYWVPTYIRKGHVKNWIFHCARKKFRAYERLAHCAGFGRPILIRPRQQPWSNLKIQKKLFYSRAWCHATFSQAFVEPLFFRHCFGLDPRR